MMQQLFLLCLWLVAIEALSHKHEKCGPNSHFVRCGSPCHKKCNKRDKITCPKICFRGCICDQGYILDDQEKCIKPEECPAPRLARAAQGKKCNRNEHYTTCGTACEPTCGKPLADMCTLQCVPDVCQCNPGF
ncbi:unnamed protein product, partial [Enterobius vermicularis]|uniref:TIL domain-containing protein n=1 Tax=Enterobius vermicularis TaxID=51028 RepID=A0A0N4UTL4_ENTVE